MKVGQNPARKLTPSYDSGLFCEFMVVTLMVIIVGLNVIIQTVFENSRGLPRTR